MTLAANEAAERAASVLMHRHADAIATMSLNAYSLGAVRDLLALAWLEGARDGLTAGRDLFSEAVEAAEREHSVRV